MRPPQSGFVQVGLQEAISALGIDPRRIAEHSETIDVGGLRATHRSALGPHETEPNNLVTAGDNTQIADSYFLFCVCVMS